MSLLKNMIVLWSGAIVDIPDGWVICDGTHGTPDLRDRFIIGAGDTYNPDDTGGASTHTHDFTTDGHTHNTAAGPPNVVQAGTGAIISNTDSGTTDPKNHLPPYYALAYIMKT